jgi:hypothetical protein
MLLALAPDIASAVETPLDWTELAAEGRFSIMAPRGTTFLRTPGTDSFTGVFQAPGFAIQVDYGLHADRLDRDRTKDAYVERAITVDGRPARLVAALIQRGSPQYFLGLHVSEVKRSSAGAVALTFTCVVAREQDLPQVEAAYLSVRFK